MDLNYFFFFFFDSHQTFYSSEILAEALQIREVRAGLFRFRMRCGATVPLLSPPLVSSATTPELTHYTDKETEAQRGTGFVGSHTAWEWQKQS